MWSFPQKCLSGHVRFHDQNVGSLSCSVPLLPSVLDLNPWWRLPASPLLMLWEEAFHPFSSSGLAPWGPLLGWLLIEVGIQSGWGVLPFGWGQGPRCHRGRRIRSLWGRFMLSRRYWGECLVEWTRACSLGGDGRGSPNPHGLWGAGT